MRSVHKYGMTTIDAASTIVKSMELAASVLTQVHEQELNRQGFVENDSSYEDKIKNHLIDINRSDLIDKICIQEVLPPED